MSNFELIWYGRINPKVGIQCIPCSGDRSYPVFYEEWTRCVHCERDLPDELIKKREFFNKMMNL